MGTYQSRFDAKGRMSVPAPYRTLLRAASTDAAAALVLWPSNKHRCIDAWPAASFAALAARFDQLDMFGADEDDLTTDLYARAYTVEPDKEGRIGVPDSLVQHARLSESVLFMGKGRFFQIWEPGAGASRLDAARDGVALRGITLPPART